MARTRLKTFPNTTIQSTGWTARARTSVGSRISFFNSISAMAAVCWKKAKTAEGSAEAANVAPGCAYVTIISLLLNGAPAVMNENVVERGARADAGFQVRGRSSGGDLAQVHDGELIAEFLGFIHGVGGDQNGHLKIAAQLEQAF